MNCNALRNDLLGLEEPARPAEASARNHLVRCPACRAWHRRLVYVERTASRLPVPSSAGARDAFVRSFLVGDEAAAKPPASPRRSVALFLGSLILDRHASPRRRTGAGVVIGVAASLLLFVAGWLVWHGQQQDARALAVAQKAPADPLVAELARRSVAVKVEEGATARQRIEAMADAAEQMRRRNKDLASGASAPEMDQWAKLYVRVVKEGILGRAGELPVAERREILEPIAVRLQEAGSEATRLLTEAGVREQSKNALREIAVAAAEGCVLLQNLYKTDRS